MNATIQDRDLTKQAPHSPRERIDGFAIAARTVDKCRAKAAGTVGEYHYDCPLDNMLFNFKGITAAQFTTAVAAAKDYSDVGAWLHSTGTKKTIEEVKAWSDRVEASSPLRNPERHDAFVANCNKLGINPETSSTFDWLEADDSASFKPASKPTT
ncbi:MAG: hypothetical protein JWR26_2475 [Pedosphaera sp.]|nr:hypothetical protein [Pedosphaera sp.]